MDLVLKLLVGTSGSFSTATDMSVDSTSPDFTEHFTVCFRCHTLPARDVVGKLLFMKKQVCQLYTIYTGVCKTLVSC